eukprot:2892320-Amphidinium_carterae.2
MQSLEDHQAELDMRLNMKQVVRFLPSKWFAERRYTPKSYEKQESYSTGKQWNGSTGGRDYGSTNEPSGSPPPPLPQAEHVLCEYCQRPTLQQKAMLVHVWRQA